MTQLTSFETEVLSQLGKLHTRLDGIDSRLDQMDLRFDGIDSRLDQMDLRFDGIDSRLDGMESRLTSRLDSLDEKTDALWTLSNQAFAAISEIRSEVNPPWKTSRPFTQK